jgi:hypothetical protein
MKRIWAAAVLVCASLATGASAHAAETATTRTIAALKARIAATRLEIDRVRAYDEIENLHSAYGYYLDKNFWDHIADLFARQDSSMELAQRGVYVGQDHIRAFLHDFGGPEGPRPDRLQIHAQLQPVIHVSADGKTAHMRVRMMQIMGQPGRNGSWGGAIYENTAVKEDGVWKMQHEHAFNTFNANYVGGPAKAASGFLPGPSKKVPPDKPPSVVFKSFPVMFTELPYHYKNPVTGR